MKDLDDAPALHWAKGKGIRVLSLLRGSLRLVAIREEDDVALSFTLR